MKTESDLAGAVLVEMERIIGHASILPDELVNPDMRPVELHKIICSLMYEIAVLNLETKAIHEQLKMKANLQ